MTHRLGRVSLVAGPIGNLEDITLRALNCLRSCDAIACEDTRHSARLLTRHEIPRKPLFSFHQHNEASRSAEIVRRIQENGEHIAVLTDAGMPSVSDPGFRLVRACIEAEIPLEVLPGPSAVVTAVAGSGLATDAFHFGGFLPHKSGRRRNELERAAERTCTSVYYESPHRILKTLNALAEIDPDREVCVARELTKKFETFHRGTAPALASAFEEKPAKGEITLLISGKADRKQKRPRYENNSPLP